MNATDRLCPQLPRRAGIGLKPEHFNAIHAGQTPPGGFFEVHAENHLVDGGPMRRHLARIRERHAVTVHGVGLSIGGQGPLDTDHLDAVARLVEWIEPAAFSEHLAWSTHAGVFLSDLLPPVYDGASLQRVCEHVDRVQSRLRRPMLLENPATYLGWAGATWSEGDFLREVLRRTGCGLLLDVNNVHVSAVNHGASPLARLRELPLDGVAQIHLAGHAEDVDECGHRLLIDTHGAPVDAAVWWLYEQALAVTGPVPTLIERDQNLPALALLLDEARQAQERLDRPDGHTRRPTNTREKVA